MHVRSGPARSHELCRVRSDAAIRVRECFHHPKGSLASFPGHRPAPTALSPGQLLICFPSRCLFWVLNINRILEHMVFCGWLLSSSSPCGSLYQLHSFLGLSTSLSYRWTVLYLPSQQGMDSWVVVPSRLLRVVLQAFVYRFLFQHLFSVLLGRH